MYPNEIMLIPRPTRQLHLIHRLPRARFTQIRQIMIAEHFREVEKLGRQLRIILFILINRAPLVLEAIKDAIGVI